MKLHYPILFIVSLLLMAGCNDTSFVEEESTGTQKTFTLSASMPGSGGPDTRVTAGQVPDSKNIALKWKEGDKIQLYFKSGDNIIPGDEVEVQNISTDGQKADFTVTLPPSVSGNFHLYGVHGTSSEIKEDSILLDATPGNFVKLEDAKVPLYFKLENVDTGSPGQSVTFQHFGALQVITLKNTVNQKITLGNPSLVFTGGEWYHDATSNEYPLFDIVSGKSTTKVGTSSSPETFTVEIAFKDNVKLAQWVMPNGKNPPAIQFKVEKGGTEYTTSQKDARTSPLVAGNAYHLYALWDGTSLAFTDEAAVQAYKITMTTSKEIPYGIRLWINADEADKSDVWIDLDNNGVKDNGEEVTEFENSQNYTITSQTVTLYGKVAILHCPSNFLTALDVSQNTALTNLDCSFNFLTALDVSKNTALTYLKCPENFLTALDVSKNTALTYLKCPYNSLTKLDVSSNTALTYLNCSDNPLTALDVSNNTALTDLTCYNSSLTALDVSNNTALTDLECSVNSLTALDVSNNTELEKLWCYNNKINGDEMTTLVESLPDRRGESEGQFYVIDTNSDGNVCTKAQVGIATDKNWEVKDTSTNLYPGS